MVFERFTRNLWLRLAALIICLFALAFALTRTAFIAAPILLLIVAAVIVWDLVRYVRRTNHELSRFLDAVYNADFSQRFDLDGLGAGFGPLGAALDDLMQRFRASRATQEQELRRLRALVEHSPVPLLSVRQDGRTSLLNNAARRLFNRAEIARLDDLAEFGTDIIHAIERIAPGEREIAPLTTTDRDEKLALSVTEMTVAGELSRLISLQNIQSELEATELEAWQRLVRVLNHEIMNSITPISSLARTAAELVETAKQTGKSEALLDDIHEAVDTVARRAEGLTHFVQSYQELTRLPDPNQKAIEIKAALDRIKALVEPDLASRNIRLEINVNPPRLQGEVDRDQFDQVIINLIQNAAEAINDGLDGQILLRALVSHNGRLTISVSDNGPGIDEEALEKIFIPFFTTKRSGTGVGLALTKQIMRAHGGTVRADGCTTLGGAKLTLIF
ncbi:MAG: ATP-binding protein [Pseudomonadota bacterium]